MGSDGKKTLVLTKSEEIFKEAKVLIPGGVNSPVRALTPLGDKPIVMNSAKGARLYDVDGNEYIDYLTSWGIAILGHANEKVLAALAEAMKKGTTFGAPNPLENIMAKMVIDALPSIEMVRFVNSGTEACMSVLRLARAFTGRQKVIMFDGSYHGHADPFLVKAGGGGIATLGLRELKNPAARDTLISSFNDVAAVEALFETHKGEIAALILEPLVGNSGYLEPKPGFLNFLRQITKDNGTLLIFDEVKTGFRLSYGGAQQYYGINPDLTTLGKIIGGGLPVGAYGGRRDIMEMVAPIGPVYQAGTLSGNPLVMAAGIATLERLQEEGTYEYLDKLTNELITGILETGRKAGHDICGGYTSGIWGFFFSKGPVNCMADAKKSDTKKYERFWKRMIEEGVHLPPIAFEAGYMSLAHTLQDIRFTIEAAERVFRKI